MKPNPRRGFTLLEMLVVMMALGVLLMIVGTILAGLLRTQQTSNDDFQRLLIQSALADRFREDVARAAQAPERLEDDAAGPECLILRFPDDSHVVYRWKEGQLLRWHVGTGEQMQQTLPVGGEHVRAAFRREGPAGRLVVLELIGERHRLPLGAALGGDLR